MQNLRNIPCWVVEMVPLVFSCPKNYIKVPIHHVHPIQGVYFLVLCSKQYIKSYSKKFSKLIIKNDPPERKYCAFDIFVSSDFHSIPIFYALSFYFWTSRLFQRRIFHWTIVELKSSLSGRSGLRTIKLTDFQMPFPLLTIQSNGFKPQSIWSQESAFESVRILRHFGMEFTPTFEPIFFIVTNC